MGRYGGGSNDEAYDRSFYLTLWNGQDILNRDLVKERLRLEFVRLHITVCAHPWWVCDALISNYFNQKIIMISQIYIIVIYLKKDEREKHDDGMYHRFIFVVPKQVELNAEDLYSAPPSRVTLASIFLFIQMVHVQFREYSFDEQAKQVLVRVFDMYG